jgi:hypothetical protein
MNYALSFLNIVDVSTDLLSLPCNYPDVCEGTTVLASHGCDAYYEEQQQEQSSAAAALDSTPLTGSHSKPQTGEPGD